MPHSSKNSIIPSKSYISSHGERKPNYLHFCDGCTFLGEYTWESKLFDLYTCQQGRKWPTVIARYSSDDPDYESGLHTAIALEAHPSNESDRTHPLVEAMKRAKEYGLISRKEVTVR